MKDITYILWLELRFRLKRVLLGVVYRPPDSMDFFFEFTNILARATAEANKTIMLAGDFNCDMLSMSSRQTRLLNEIIEEFQLIQVIQDPTRVTNNSSILIDLILCSEAGLISNAKSLPCSLSDHHLVYCVMSVHSSKPPVKFVTTRHLHKCDPSDIIPDLSKAPWQVLETFDDLDDVVEAWNVLFLEILNRHAPAQKIRVRAKSLPWVDDELRVLMRQRDWLHKKAIESGDNDLWDIYRAARNHVNVELKRSKAEYFHGLCSNSKKHASQLWKHINELLSRNSKATVESVCIGNSEISDPEPVAEVLNNHFISAAGVFPSTEAEIELPASPTIRTTFRLKTVTQNTVLELIQSLDPGKSSGPGDISTRCLKLTAPGIVAPHHTQSEFNSWQGPCSLEMG